MKRLLLATRNRHKTREFAQLLGADFDLRDLTSQTELPHIQEAGTTFEENATIKALAVSRFYPNEIVIADDSGLCVEALGGAPGIFSARYAGENASDQQNIRKLLRELKSPASSLVPRARFYCVIVVAENGQLLTRLAGEVTGRIIAAPQGTNGFGYDPVFVPDGFSQTFAELPSEVKNRISHRAEAAKRLRGFLRNCPS